MLLRHDELVRLYERLHAAEMTHDRRNARKGGAASFDTVRRVDLWCKVCDDKQRANCADTVLTFALMHPACTVEALQIP